MAKLILLLTFLLLTLLAISSSSSKLRRKVLSKPADLYYALSWRKSARSSWISFQTEVDQRVNWIGFGIADVKVGEELTEVDDVIPSDWVIAWKDRHNVVHVKDCNTMEDTLHFDKRQNYHIVPPKRPRSLNFTVKRQLDTHDENDIEIQAGKMQLIWGYGYERTFARIRSKIESVQNMLGVNFLSNPTLERSTPLPEHSTSLPEKPLSEQPAPLPMRTAPLLEKFTPLRKTSEPIQEKHSLITHKRKESEHLTHAAEARKQQKNNELSRKIETTKPQKKGNQIQVKKLPATNLPLQPRKNYNCTTVIIQKTASWYEILKIKERSVYYLIIGTSAIIASFLVIILACCCGKTSRPLPRKFPASKVAFYNVDDYDDEQVEFLKERS